LRSDRLVLLKGQCLSSVTRILAVIFILSALAGCVPSLKSGPDRVFARDYEAAAIRDQFGFPDFQAFSALSDRHKIDFRNQFISARMYAIDLQYTSYEAGLTKERQEIGFLGSVTSIALSSTASLVAADITKNVLSAASAGLTGAQAAYNDEVLLQRTMQVLQSQMRANRARVSAQIIQRMRLPSSEYPLGMALSDLESYYQAGTITGALVQVHETLGQEVAAAEVAKDAAILRSTRTSDTPSRLLLAYLYPNGAAGRRDEARAQRLTALLRDRGVKMRLGWVLTSSDAELIRRQLAQDAHLLP